MQARAMMRKQVVGCSQLCGRQGDALLQQEDACRTSIVVVLGPLELDGGRWRAASQVNRWQRRRRRRPTKKAAARFPSTRG